MIVGDAFGVDRMDYLLRDSLHTGVQYGRFDAERLINTLRVIPEPPKEAGGGDGVDPVLGCERGGLHAAEQLVLARYFMYSQVYRHPTRLAYNVHLRDFLSAWLPSGQFPVNNVDRYVAYDDHRVFSAITTAAATPSKPGHAPAKRIVTRDHFRKAYVRRQTPDPGDQNDLQGDRPGDVKALADAAEGELGTKGLQHRLRGTTE